MGTISRQGTAPIQDGETASGTEVEAEFNTIFTEINGNLDNANIASSAGIVGSKLANATVNTAQIASNAVTTAKMAAAAVPKAYIDDDTGTETFTTSTTYVDVPGITAATLTPGSTSDFIFLDFTLVARSDGAGNDKFVFGFSVDGTQSADLIIFDDTDQDPIPQHHVSWAQVAPSASSMIIKPTYRKIAGVGAAEFGDGGQGYTGATKIFRVLIVPIK